VEILMVDNLSQDGSVSFVRERFSDVKVFENDINNYTKAINLGIKNSNGDFIALLNNDTTVDREWLTGLLKVMDGDKKIGAVQSKILFSDGDKINSTGGEEIEDFYFRDIGFGERDKGQYNKVKEIDYFSGGSVMFRRECLEDVGVFDEDFIMFFEDIDYSIRCRAKGWKLFYSPLSIVYHRFHGSASTELCSYLCSRNRFLCIAKHFPLKLPRTIKSSHFYIENQYDLLYRTLMQAVKKIFEYHDSTTAEGILDSIRKEIIDIFGHAGTYNFFSQLELLLGLRKIRVGIYDHAFHFAGGGQRYVAKLAEIIQEMYDVTYIANKDITLDRYREWFDIDLSKCKLKIIKIPFFERDSGHFIDENIITSQDGNPFDVISKESLYYDIFINANMLSKVNPLSTLSIFVCHFPDRTKERFFHVDKYDYIVSNGMYTSSWVKKKWNINPTHLIFPPVDMYSDNNSLDKKKKIILSVARFEIGGSKKQFEMANAFIDLISRNRNIKNEWKLVLAGGNSPANPYFEKVKKLVDSAQCNIELRPNLNYAELKELYSKASIFWHACGLNETDPHLVEHFGMTTVEAMQNYCVPIVIDGGGQREIVEHGESGFRFKTIEELQLYTMNIINDENLRKQIAIKAYKKSHDFNFDVFREKIIALFSEIENELIGEDVIT
ncbi:MAG: glycosyltransferase, partial [Nitrospirae bacterium]|nr:glycosyltransferase [Nitrospirota bacterium]